MRCSTIAPALLLALASTPAAAAVAWTGDFETGDLSQFDFVLNGTVGGTDYATVVQDMVLQGAHAARIELHDDAVWPNGLRRVELQHLPEAARTAEGATTCFGWSFHLPETLPEDPGHTLGYWESQDSYQQMMAFNTNGDDIRFITQQPSYTEHWNAQDVLTPGVWHRISMCVLWSQDPGVGLVHVWFDGQQVVTAASAKTLADGNPHFAQIGLLRGNVNYPGVPVIYIDDVVEGDTIEDVDPPEPPGGSDSGDGTADDTGNPPPATGTGPEDDTGPSTSGSNPTSGSADATEGPEPTPTDGSSGPPDASGDDEGKGCGCRTRGEPASPWWLAWLGALGLRRRRR
ncbi:heparin lyase I family protein [Paraliomyxa miuraensis]|uniref:heparin lyase I family protein n=1 Tax=Paraliomyxa miuraensis TaxID=376150 RepID=UPI0022594591|nr:heparin lyase I family protein [Paraliomyxa miuraensis]MCX4245749.1 heparin lyase I family protein [Paraliomyxa miuraensis]